MSFVIVNVDDENGERVLTNVRLPSSFRERTVEAAAKEMLNRYIKTKNLEKGHRLSCESVTVSGQMLFAEDTIKEVMMDNEQLDMRINRGGATENNNTSSSSVCTTFVGEMLQQQQQQPQQMMFHQQSQFVHHHHHHPMAMQQQQHHPHHQMMTMQHQQQQHFHPHHNNINMSAAPQSMEPSCSMTFGGGSRYVSQINSRQASVGNNSSNLSFASTTTNNNDLRGDSMNVCLDATQNSNMGVPQPYHPQSYHHHQQHHGFNPQQDMSFIPQQQQHQQQQRDDTSSSELQQPTTRGSTPTRDSKNARKTIPANVANQQQQLQQSKQAGTRRLREVDTNTSAKNNNNDDDDEETTSDDDGRPNLRRAAANIKKSKPQPQQQQQQQPHNKSPGEKHQRFLDNNPPSDSKRIPFTRGSGRTNDDDMSKLTENERSVKLKELNAEAAKSGGLGWGTEAHKYLPANYISDPDAYLRQLRKEKRAREAAEKAAAAAAAAAAGNGGKKVANDVYDDDDAAVACAPPAKQSKKAAAPKPKKVSRELEF